MEIKQHTAEQSMDHEEIKTYLERKGKYNILKPWYDAKVVLRREVYSNKCLH